MAITGVTLARVMAVDIAMPPWVTGGIAVMGGS
jgi:hypothetical protein